MVIEGWTLSQITFADRQVKPWASCQYNTGPISNHKLSVTGLWEEADALGKKQAPERMAKSLLS